MAAAAPARATAGMSAIDVAALTAAVQRNCHIADARHATEMTLCIYLLQMRELYRWEQGLPLGAALRHADVGEWLDRREQLWDELAGADYAPLPLGAQQVDAFDADAVNGALRPLGLVYGAGLAGPDRPGFFLARIEALREPAQGPRVQVCGREHARGLFAPPAALLGDTIVLRRESLARWLWEKFEAFGVKRADGPFKAVADAYDLDRDFLAALPRMLDEQGETLILHELGEHRVGQRLEPGWAAMRLALRDRRSELHVRAVRDHLVDLEVTLPTLLQREAATAIHFWFAGFDGVRRLLYPTLPDAYAAWCAGDGGRALRRAAQRGAAHFAGLADEVLALHARHGAQAGPHIETLLTAPDAVCRDAG
jgi:hypothetical protein